jgi:hypothetical protein
MRQASRLVLLLLSLAVVALAAGCDDRALQGNVGEAHQITVDVRVGDFFIERAAGTPTAGGELATIPTHTDLTVHVTNAGKVAHTIGLYASETDEDLLTATPPLDPGASADLRFHFHDPQVVYVRDGGYRDRMNVRLRVE